MQSYQLLKQNSNKECVNRISVAKDLLYEFAIVCYTLSSEPVRSYAFQPSDAYHAWNFRVATDASFINKISKLVPLYKLGIQLCKKAMILDPVEWQYSYMQAKLSKKLHKNQNDIIGLLIAAIRLLPEDSGTKEQEKILDAHYSLVTYVQKLTSLEVFT